MNTHTFFKKWGIYTVLSVIQYIIITVVFFLFFFIPLIGVITQAHDVIGQNMVLLEQNPEVDIFNFVEYQIPLKPYAQQIFWILFSFLIISTCIIFLCSSYSYYDIFKPTSFKKFLLLYALYCIGALIVFLLLLGVLVVMVTVRFYLLIPYIIDPLLVVMGIILTYVAGFLYIWGLRKLFTHTKNHTKKNIVQQPILLPYSGVYAVVVCSIISLFIISSLWYFLLVMLVIIGVGNWAKLWLLSSST
jgi:hypothetical protein